MSALAGVDHILQTGRKKQTEIIESKAFHILKYKILVVTHPSSELLADMI